MDWTLYFILASSLATVSVAWRTFKQDHPALGAYVKNMPFIGTPLSCGFCFPMWLTFFALLFISPVQPVGIATTLGLLQTVLEFVIAWMTVGFGVLTMRFLLVALQDGAAVLAHMHRASHKH